MGEGGGGEVQPEVNVPSVLSRKGCYLAFRASLPGGIAIHRLYRYVPLSRVWFSSSLVWDRQLDRVYD